MRDADWLSLWGFAAAAEGGYPCSLQFAVTRGVVGPGRLSRVSPLRGAGSSGRAGGSDHGPFGPCNRIRQRPGREP